MVAALDPTVAEKIARRAKRAWEDFDKGGSAAFHRISHLTKDELKYRLRHEPGSYSRAGKKIKVVRKGKDILVAPRDPKLDLQGKKNLKELKDREGPVRAYRLVGKDGSGPQKNSYDTKLKVGDKITGTVAVGTFEWCKEHFRHKSYPNGQRILAIEFESEDITDRDPTLRVNAGKVVEELDLIAFGIKKTPTTGLIDCLTKKDVAPVQDHTGTVRAYRVAHPAEPKVAVGDKITTSQIVGSLEWCKGQYTRGDRILAVELDAADIESVDDQLTVKAGEIKEDLDLIALGLKKKAKPGLLDCLTDQDVKDLVEDHVGTIRAYKHVTKDGDSPHQTQKIRYELGRKYEELNADTNRDKDCSHGLNVASLEWVQRDRGKGGKDARIFAVELHSDDLACVPAKTDGKFRTRKLTVVAEIDPQTEKEIASIPPPAPPPAKSSMIEDLYNRGPDGKKIAPATPKPEKPAKAKKDGILDTLKKKLKGKSKDKG